jgi:hypothetical protein
VKSVLFSSSVSGLICGNGGHETGRLDCHFETDVPGLTGIIVKFMSTFPSAFSSFPDLDGTKGSVINSEPKRRNEKDKRRSKKALRRGEQKDRDHVGGSSNMLEYAGHSGTEINKTGDTSTRAFYSDRHGDPLNLRYDGLDKGSVPKYKSIAGSSFFVSFNRC